jgi:hypothetical protein
MIDPNRGASDEVLEQQKEESYERMRLQLFEAVEKKLAEFGMTWDDLAAKLKWESFPREGIVSGDKVRAEVGDGLLVLEEVNDIAHCFSAEAYIIFRPRFPITQT